MLKYSMSRARLEDKVKQIIDHQAGRQEQTGLS
jgi:hypothetical protein